MRTVSDHQRIVADLLPRTPVVMLALAEAAGLTLAVDVVAARALPAFDNSAMDGYAVRAVDVAAATDQAPVALEVRADVPAGRVDGPPLDPGTAHRIMTGAPMPRGADAVVQVEATDGGTETVRVHESRAPGVHVRTAGEDVAVGDTVLDAGTRLGAAQLGLLAALGLGQVQVHRRVRVLVLSTGSELVAAGTDLLHGQIHESNGIMLATAVREAGGEAEQVQFVSDDVDELNAALAARLGEVDLLVTSGGVSAGAYEVVKDAFTGHGVEFAKVAMQPGMPQGAGRINGVPVVTLPGNPVSALVSFEVFLRPALRSAAGLPHPHRTVVRARLSEGLRSPAGRRQFRRGVLGATGTVGGSAVVRPIGPPASHFLRWLAASDCLIDVDEATTTLEVGDEVDVWVLD